jgi:Holliday junction resolvase RusA-like endonuclease
VANVIEIHLTLIPPSINRIWRVDRGGRPHKSDEYRKWLMASGLEANAQVRRRKISGPYKLSVQIARPDKRRRDLDNIGFKAISDLLVQIGVIEDDSLCEMLSARWVTNGSGVSVRIEAAGTE